VAAVPAIAQTLPVTAYRAPPMLLLVIGATATATATVLDFGQDRLGWPWPVGSCLALLVAVYRVAVFFPRRLSVAATAGTAAAVVLPAAWTVPLPVGLVVLNCLALAAATLVGSAVRARLAADVALRSEVARTAVVQERTRIARELHDVVAHQLSLIAIQAEAAPHSIPDLPDAARAAYSDLRRLSRMASPRCGSC
jgi:signal transduction histidine kinase